MADIEAIKAVEARLRGLAPRAGACAEIVASCADMLSGALTCAAAEQEAPCSYNPEHVRALVRAFRALQWPAKLEAVGGLTHPRASSGAESWLEDWRSAPTAEQANVLFAIALEVRDAINKLASSRAHAARAKGEM